MSRSSSWLVDATIAYDGAGYGDGDKLVAPLGEDLKFSVKAAEGAEVMVAATSAMRMSSSRQKRTASTS